MAAKKPKGNKNLSSLTKIKKMKKKIIDLPETIMDDLQIIAIKEKRRGKTDPKNFIEDLVISYVEDNKNNKKKLIHKPPKNK